MKLWYAGEGNAGYLAHMVGLDRHDNVKHTITATSL